MALLRASILAICFVAATILAAPSPTTSTGPLVRLDRGTFVGTTANGTNQFRGIAFAKPSSVVHFCLALHLTDFPNRFAPTELATCDSVGQRPLRPTEAPIMRLRLAFHAPNNQIPRRRLWDCYRMQRFSSPGALALGNNLLRRAKTVRLLPRLATIEQH